MKLRLQEKIKINQNLFNMKTATKTFKKILEKEYLEKRFKLYNKNISKKSDKFFNMINKSFFKEEIKEKDQDYIYREIKLLQKHHQNIIDLYGKNSQNRIITTDTEPIKYDKKLLFNPFKKENELINLNKRNKNDIIFFKEKKRMFLPFIKKQNNKIRLIKKALNNNNNFNKSNFSEKKEKNNISKYNSLNTESSSNYPNQYLIHNKNKNNNSKMSQSSERNQFNKNEYLETLDSLYEEITDKQIIQTRYFNSYDYGCSFNKNKCQYISKTLFNN